MGVLIAVSAFLFHFMKSLLMYRERGGKMFLACRRYVFVYLDGYGETLRGT